MRKGYKPKLQKRYTQRIASWLLVAAALCLWIFRERLGLEISELCLISGAAVFNLTLQIVNMQRAKENYLRAVELKERRDKLSVDDFIEKAEIFFKDN
ncbi:MAG: hypothetical protein IJ446_10715 [Oscillospiraceae bacterium]|nr:hypothetical protein [Oscillospiraceae bacterium]